VAREKAHEGARGDREGERRENADADLPSRDDPRPGRMRGRSCGGPRRLRSGARSFGRDELRDVHRDFAAASFFAARARRLLQGVRHVRGGREAIPGIPLEGAGRDIGDGLRYVGREGARIGYRECPHAVECLHRVLATEESCAGEGLPQYDSGREHVASSIRRLALDDLGRKVAVLAFDLSHLGLVGQTTQRLGDAEVGEPRDPVEADEDILRRDVTMDEVEGMASVVAELVSGVEPGESVPENPQDDGLGDPARFAPAPRSLLQTGE
jgi:hypothetical protein